MRKITERRSTHFKSTLILTLSALLLATGLAGCGTSDNADQTNASAEPATSTAQPDAESQTDQSSQPSKPDYADAQAIRQGLIGYTVSGKMSSGTQYGEYYAPDGTIRAADYTGKWYIKNDTLCLDYGNNDATDCYRVAFSGQMVTWYLDGQANGSGTVAPGNPNDF